MTVLLSFGHGYSARAFGRRLLGEGWRVIGTSRSPQGAARIAATGAEAVVWPGAGMTAYLDAASHLLISAAPEAGGDPVLARLRDAIARRAGRFEWVGYLSTTAVYGDRQGGWVDETSALAPATERGRRRVAAEKAWLSVPGLPVHVFRLAGIYGPGRGPFAKVLAGTARRIVKPGQVFSRIHRDDIAQVLRASVARPNPGAVYNVCDNCAAPPQDVIAEAARLLGVPVPPAEPFAQAEMSAMARSFYAESKRVSNRRIREELGVTLIHPDYRHGLRALLAEAENGQF
ncbi:MAG: SDR family oxidoreductase [Paracoccaceae bacterium]